MTSANICIEDIEDAQGAIRHRSMLGAVRSFLITHDADDELVETVEIALDLCEQYIEDNIDEAVLQGQLIAGSA